MLSSDCAKPAADFAQSDKNERWLRLPDSVLFDGELSPTALKVYCLLARYSRQRRVEISSRVIGRTLSLSRRTVDKAAGQLRERGHVSLDVGLGQRRAFTLQSNVFGSPPDQPAPKEVKLAQCGRCAKRLRRLLKHGVCRECVQEERIRALLAEVGEVVDFQALAVRLRMEKLTLKIQRIYERMKAEREGSAK